MKLAKNALRVLLPVAVLVLCFFIGRQVISGKKKVKRHASPPVVSVVDAEAARKTDFRIVVKSHGTVRARTESAVVPEVSGKVVEISDNMREGGFFAEGELLMRLDPRNYANEVALKEAELAKAAQLLAEEEARAAIALRNWERLRGVQTPNPLAVREPQLMSARAELRAARAKLDRAELDLERTRILAPYCGRVLEKSVDLGEYVTGGSSVARVYAVDFAEVRLPLSARELDFVDIKERYRKESAKDKDDGPRAYIVSTSRGREYKWNARIVRSEGAVDEKSRQLFVVAEVADPYGKKPAATGDGQTPPLKVGAFVEARIQGRLLRGVYVVPRRALRVGKELFIIKDGLLERRRVNVVWQDVESVVVDGGLEEGEFIVTTPSVYMKGGKFRVAGAAPPAAAIKDKAEPVRKTAPAAKVKAPTAKSPVKKAKPVQKPKPAPKQKDSSKAGGWDLSELDKKPAPVKEQPPTTNKKPSPSPTTLGITLPAGKTEPTTLGITLPKSAPKSKKPAEVKGSTSAPTGWVIPAFDGEDKGKGEVAR